MPETKKLFKKDEKLEENTIKKEIDTTSREIFVELNHMKEQVTQEDDHAKRNLFIFTILIFVKILRNIMPN